MRSELRKSSWLEDGYAGAEYGEWSVQPSDGHSVLQWKRKGKCRPPFSSKYKRKLKDPSRGYTTKPETKAPLVAVMQALHYHFHKSMSEVARITDRRLANVCAVVGCAGASANTMQWWRRKYQKEAIEAAGQLLKNYTDLTVAS